MDTGALAELVSRRREVLGHLLQLGMRQIELTQGSDWSQLSKVLSAKERLLSLLKQIEAELEPYRRESPDGRVWASPQQRETCRRDAEECGALLGQLVELERQSEAAMVRRRDAAAARLSGMNVGGTACGAYIVDGPTSVGFDLVSEG